MSGERTERTRLGAVVRGALIATAIGGAFFVVSQLSSHDAASAEPVVASSSQPSGGLLGGALSGLGGVLGQVTGGVAGAAHDATGLVQNTVSSVTSILPDNVQQSVTNITAPITGALGGVQAAAPVSSVVKSVSGAVDQVVAAVPVVSQLTGSHPVSSLLNPSGAQLSDTVGSTVGAVSGVVTGTPDASAPSILPALPSLPDVPGLGVVPALPQLPGIPGITIPSGPGVDNGDGTVTVPVDTDGDGVPDGTVTVPISDLPALSGGFSGAFGALVGAGSPAAPARLATHRTAAVPAAAQVSAALAGGSAPLAPAAPLGGDQNVLAVSGGASSGASRGGSGDGPPSALAGGFSVFPGVVAGDVAGSANDDLPPAVVFGTDVSPD